VYVWVFPPSSPTPSLTRPHSLHRLSSLKSQQPPVTHLTHYEHTISTESGSTFDKLVGDGH